MSECLHPPWFPAVDFSQTHIGTDRHSWNYADTNSIGNTDCDYREVAYRAPANKKKNKAWSSDTHSLPAKSSGLRNKISMRKSRWWLMQQDGTLLMSSPYLVKIMALLSELCRSANVSACVCVCMCAWVWNTTCVWVWPTSFTVFTPARSYMLSRIFLPMNLAYLVL